MLFWSIFHAFLFQMCWKIFCGLRSFLSFFSPQTSGSHNHPKNTLDNGKLYCHLANIRLFFFVHTLEMEDIYLTMVLFALTHFSLCHINHFSHTHTHTHTYRYIYTTTCCVRQFSSVWCVTMYRRRCAAAENISYYEPCQWDWMMKSLPTAKPD